MAASNALQGVGGNSYINIPTSASLGSINTTNQITISLWVYETYALAYAYPIAFATAANARAFFIQMGTGAGSNMYAYGSSGGGTLGNFTTNKEGAQNTWVNYAWTYDGSANQLKSYRDGAQIGATNTTGPTFPTWANLRIGGGYGTGDTSIEGRMDEVAIYNSIEDVGAIYTKGLAGTSLIPEPTSLALLGLGSFGLLFSRRRR